LLNLRERLDVDLKDSLDDSIKTLFRFFRFKKIGALPKILDLSLEHPDRTISFLSTISDFINNDAFNDDVTKKQIQKLKKLKNIPDDLEAILRDARTKEYSNYEKSFVGDYFDEQKTSLKLDYKCGENIEDKFIDLVDKTRNLDLDKFDKIIGEISKCVINSFKSGSTLKTDIKTKTPLYIEENGEKIQVFPSNSNFEVKKMDANIDSYLSEFFSVFKSSTNIKRKPELIELYNKFIDNLFNFAEKHGQGFLEKVKNQLSGIIYDDYIIIPIENITFYWSNVGQRGCNEKRLSIRFRINPELEGQTITGYYFDQKSDILEKKDIVVSPKDVKYKICEIFINK
jgi:hypothetical protein